MEELAVGRGDETRAALPGVVRADAKQMAVQLPVRDVDLDQELPTTGPVHWRRQGNRGQLGLDGRKIERHLPEQGQVLLRPGEPEVAVLPEPQHEGLRGRPAARGGDLDPHGHGDEIDLLEPGTEHAPERVLPVSATVLANQGPRHDFETLPRHELAHLSGAKRGEDR